MVEEIIKSGDLWYLVRENEPKRELAPSEINEVALLMDEWVAEADHMHEFYCAELQRIVSEFETHED